MLCDLNGEGDGIVVVLHAMLKKRDKKPTCFVCTIWIFIIRQCSGRTCQDRRVADVVRVDRHEVPTR